MQICHKFSIIHRECLQLKALDLEKKSSLFGLTNQQHDIDKTYLYAKGYMKQNINA